MARTSGGRSPEKPKTQDSADSAPAAGDARAAASPDFSFECQPGCNVCCNRPGLVYLTKDDVKRAAEFLGMSSRAFSKRYLYVTKHKRRFRKPPDKQCPFLEDYGCSIHPAKPTQCRTFPYWPELVEHRALWNSTAVYCPGIGKGQLVQIGEAMERAEVQRQAYPEDY